MFIAVIVGVVVVVAGLALLVDARHGGLRMRFSRGETDRAQRIRGEATRDQDVMTNFMMNQRRQGGGGPMGGV
jgi:hypothetical protein